MSTVGALALFALLAAAAASVALYRSVGLWGVRPRPREVLVVPRALGPGEGVALRFESGHRVDLEPSGRGRFRGVLPPELLGRPYDVRRTPDLAPEAGFAGQAVPARVAVDLREPLWLHPVAWSDRRPPPGTRTLSGRVDELVVRGSSRVPGDRLVRVHVPSAYAREPHRRFPLIYLLDGQNCFDAGSAFGGVEWAADEAADLLEESGGPAALVVAVDHGSVRRVHEYTFCPPASAAGAAEVGGGAAEHFAFLLEEVDPLVRSRFRVAAGPASFVGSSLGGLFVLWSALSHPRAVAGVAAMSPSVWWGRRAVLDLPAPSGRRPRVWLDMGSGEGAHSLELYRAAAGRLRSLGWREGVDLRCLEVPGGAHHESAWADRLPSALRFLLEGW